MDLVKEDRLRLRMVEEQIRRRGLRDQRVLAAMEKIPRHLFLPERLRSHAYADEPLPSGKGRRFPSRTSSPR
jgi:protein-L-isoaspartate(D-aspartate) O-methyltransferase